MRHGKLGPFPLVKTSGDPVHGGLASVGTSSLLTSSAAFCSSILSSNKVVTMFDGVILITLSSSRTRTEALDFFVL